MVLRKVEIHSFLSMRLPQYIVYGRSGVHTSSASSASAGRRTAKPDNVEALRTSTHHKKSARPCLGRHLRACALARGGRDARTGLRIQVLQILEPHCLERKHQVHIKATLAVRGRARARGVTAA